MTTITVGRDLGSTYITDGVDDQIQVQQAINAAISGDTISLTDATYNLNTGGTTTTAHGNTAIYGIFINSKSNIIVTGRANWGTILNVVDYPSSESDSTATNVMILIHDSTNITINNLEIDSAQPGRGFYVTTGPSGWWSTAGFVLYNVNNLNISNNFINTGKVGTGGTGIWGANIFYTTFNNNKMICGVGMNLTGSTLQGTTTDNNIITNNNIYSKEAYGIRIEGVGTYYTIANNIVHGAGNIGIDLYSGSNNNIVESNIVYDCSNYGIQNAMSNNNIIQKNTVYNNRDGGIHVYVAGSQNTNLSIYNNIIYGTTGAYSGQPGAGILLKKTYSNDNMRNVRVYGNTCYNNKYGIYIGSEFVGLSIDIKNNIIINNAINGIYNAGGTGYIITNSYNDVWNNTSGNYSNISAGTGSISVDPLFGNIIINDFHLKSQTGRWNGTTWINDTVTSPCIEAGDPSSDNSISLWGGRIEMGAYGNTPEASNNTTLVTTGSILGNVMDTLGINISEATISDGTRSSTTDSNGNYIIQNVPVGTYTLTASAIGYVTGSLSNIVITSGQSTTVNFTLQVICPTPICDIIITHI